MKTERSCSGVVRAALALAVLSLAPAAASAQPAPPNGPRKVAPRWHAIVNARLIAAPGEVIEDATIIFRDGVILSVGEGEPAPDGARVWDYTGLTVYPGLIESHLPVEAPTPDADEPGAHWNKKVTPQRSALDGDGVPQKKRESLRKQGFTAAAIAPKGGVLRGTGAVVLLGEPREDDSSAEYPIVVRDGVYQEAAFEAGGFGDRTYPSSQMGAIALIRQTLLDAQWRAETLDVYRRNPQRFEPPAPNDALDALAAGGAGDAPLLFNVDHELEALRGGEIASEFDREAIVLGSGTEFRRLDAIAEQDMPVIAPLTLPKKPSVETIADAHSTSLRELMTWEQAPTNPRRLADAGLDVALTTDKLRKKEKFFKNLRKAIDLGLSEKRALAMLTTSPARILGVEDRLGRVEPGFVANLLAVDGDLFNKDAQIRDVWVSGRRHEISPPPEVDPTGRWAFTFAADEDHDGTLTIKRANRGKFSVLVEASQPDEESIKARHVRLIENRLSYVVDMPGQEQSVLATAVIEGETMLGKIMTPDGRTFDWTAKRRVSEEDAEEEKKDKPDKAQKEQDESSPPPERLPTPFGAFGFFETPPQRDIVVTNATVWTAGDAGIIEDGALYIRDGKIAYVGPADDFAGPRGEATIIDAQGSHVTPGIIDAHSHTGIDGGVNEGTLAVTSEVRIADVIDPADISWYRQLAGGVTAANQLHGSANPIGGQNSVVKLRWGVDDPQRMRFDAASAGIKFALGENVKQSNWGDEFTTRYPQTRMGVETIIRDRFIAAREYQRKWDRYNSLSEERRRRTMPPRRNLRLEALLEILKGERLVHCHSYRQDEILMLTRVADDFDFTIGSFQHVLEGYKVAEAIKKHARGASAFSDWWAYKFEVYDAIPYNGAIMHDVGVHVSFNSDSDELARRLNAEAGKAVKYGGVTPNEALKFVTYNPAYQLGIHDRVGSLEVGKDGDFAIWSDDPLSPTTRCEATYIEGRKYFSIEKDKEMRQRAQAERQRIIQKILAEGRRGGDKEDKKDEDGEAEAEEPTPTSPEPNAEAESMRARGLRLLQAGLDPSDHQPGECSLLLVQENQ